MCVMCKIRKATAAAGLCVVCLGGVTDAGSLVHSVGHAAALEIHAQAADHVEQPHTHGEAAEVHLAISETEIRERHVLTLDHPIYGQLNGWNYLGGCDECPADLAGGELCYGPCPVEPPEIAALCSIPAGAAA